jgi:hypothetical protein
VVDVENAGSGHEHIMGLAAGELGIDRGRRLWVGFYDTHAGLLAFASVTARRSVRPGAGSDRRGGHR